MFTLIFSFEKIVGKSWRKIWSNKSKKRSNNFQKIPIETFKWPLNKNLHRQSSIECFRFVNEIFFFVLFVLVSKRNKNQKTNDRRISKRKSFLFLCSSSSDFIFILMFKQKRKRKTEMRKKRCQLKCHFPCHRDYWGSKWIISFEVRWIGRWWWWSSSSRGDLDELFWHRIIVKIVGQRISIGHNLINCWRNTSPVNV